jgi:hypothetical protein
MQQIHFSFFDRSPHLRISQDALQVSAATGFRSVRSNLPIREGSYYVEMIIERGIAPPADGEGDVGMNGVGEVQSKALDGPHVRLGFGRREATLSGPVGLDGYSYGIRDKTGEKVTVSRPKSYLEEGFKTGDVVGMWIYLPPCDSEPWTTGATATSSSSSLDPSSTTSTRQKILRNRIPIRYKSQLYFESLDPPIPKEMEVLMDPPAANSGTNASSSHPASSASNHPSKKKKSLIIANQTLPSVDSHINLSASSGLRPLPTLKGSKIAFFVNGKSPGVAFEDLYDFRSLKEEVKKRRGGSGPMPGEEGLDDGWLGYFAMASCYGGGRVKINPGPEWKRPPDFSNFEPIPAVPAPMKAKAPAADAPAPEAPVPGSSVPASEVPVSLDSSASSFVHAPAPNVPAPDVPAPDSSASASGVPPPLSSDSIASSSLLEEKPLTPTGPTFEPISDLPIRYQPYQDWLDDSDEALFLETYDPSVPSSSNPTVLADAAVRKREAEEATLSAALGRSSVSNVVKKRKPPGAASVGTGGGGGVGGGGGAGATKSKSKLGTMGDGVKNVDSRVGSGSTTPGLVWKEEEKEKVVKAKVKRELRPVSYKASEAMDVDADGVYRGGGILGVGSSRAVPMPPLQGPQPPPHHRPYPQHHYSHPSQSGYPQRHLPPGYPSKLSNGYPPSHSPHRLQPQSHPLPYSQPQRPAPSPQHLQPQKPHQQNPTFTNSPQAQQPRPQPPPPPSVRSSGSLERATDFLTQHLLSALPASNSTGPSSFSAPSSGSSPNQPLSAGSSATGRTSFSSSFAAKFSQRSPIQSSFQPSLGADLGLPPPVQQQSSYQPLLQPSYAAPPPRPQQQYDSSLGLPPSLFMSASASAPPPRFSPTDPRSFQQQQLQAQSQPPAGSSSFSSSYNNAHRLPPPQAAHAPRPSGRGFAAAYGMQQPQQARPSAPMFQGEADAEGEMDEEEVKPEEKSMAMTGVEGARGS